MTSNTIKLPGLVPTKAKETSEGRATAGSVAVGRGREGGGGDEKGDVERTTESETKKREKTQGRACRDGVGRKER